MSTKKNLNTMVASGLPPSPRRRQISQWRQSVRTIKKILAAGTKGYLFAFGRSLLKLLRVPLMLPREEMVSILVVAMVPVPGDQLALDVQHHILPHVNHGLSNLDLVVKHQLNHHMLRITQHHILLRIKHHILPHVHHGLSNLKLVSQQKLNHRSYTEVEQETSSVPAQATVRKDSKTWKMMATVLPGDNDCGWHE